jgi:putative oxidoreductase
VLDNGQSNAQEGRMNSEPSVQKLFFPALDGFYAAASKLSYPMIRFIVGVNLIPHGGQKLFGWFGGDMTKTIDGFASMGFEPAAFWTYLVAIVELFGGILVAIGFLTRPAAFAVVIFMAVAVFFVHWSSGFFWPEGGFEYPLMWGIIALAILFRGGGPLSVDRALGKEF